MHTTRTQLFRETLTRRPEYNNVRPFVFRMIGGLLLAAGLFPVEAFAQPVLQWHVGLGTDFEEHVHEGMQTSDGGYIGVGHGNEGASGNKLDMLIIKTDGSGNEQWQARVGTSGQMDLGIAIAETGSGYVVGGGLHASGGQKRALVGLDLSGNVVWQQTYSGNGSGAVRGVEVLGNGDIVATGYYGSDEEGFLFLAEATAFLMKTDSTGNLIWDKTLPGMQGTKVRQESGGGFAILSSEWTFSGGSDTLNAKVIRTDASGNETWSGYFGGSNHIEMFDFDLTTDGGFVLAGHTTGYGVANWDCLMIRAASDGSELWSRLFGQPRGYDADYIHDECYGIRQTASGGFVMVGGSGDEYPYSASGHASGPSDEWKTYVIGTDTDGNTLYEEVFGDGANQGNNAGEYVALTDTGCFLVFNDTDSASPPAPNNFGFMKLCADCGNGTVDAGEGCDDGNQVDCDGCDSDCQPSSTCGNGISCSPEDCDDGNTTDGDCCSATCTFESVGSACDDGSLCSSEDACDGAGSCSGSQSPATTCLIAGSGKIDIRDKEGERKDSISWDWKKGPQNDYAGFGDPAEGNTDYALCIYDVNGGVDRIAASLDAPAGGSCGGRACWKASPGKKVSYKDKELTPDGIQQLQLKAGAANKGKLKLKAKGASLTVPALPFTQTPSLVVQLKNSAGTCWSTAFDTSEAGNEADRFRAKY